MAAGAREMLTAEWDPEFGGVVGEFVVGEKTAAPPPRPLVPPADWSSEVDGDLDTPGVSTRPPIPAPPWRETGFAPGRALELAPVEPFRPPPPNWEAEGREEAARARAERVAAALTEELPSRHPPPRRLPAS